MPFGGEYARSIAQFFVWDRMMECGTCALWAQNMGGFPVFNDYFSSFMHPFSFIFSVIFGGFRGATFTLAASFLLMGLATWWLMILIGQSRVVQIWAPIVAMYGGQMTGRLETGSIGLPLSLASAMLVIAATVAFVQHVNMRNTVLLGISMASMLLAGQLYMQLGTLLSLPVLLSYIQQEATFKDYLLKQRNYIILAILLTLLLIAPILLTNIFEYGTTYKKNTDPLFNASQPLGFLVLNMLIDVPDFFRTDMLRKLPFPYAYSIFVGYPVLIFALVGYIAEQDIARRRYMNAFFVVCAMNFILAAAVPQKLLIGVLPQQLVDILASMRFIVLLNGLAVIFLVIASSYGLEIVVQRSKEFQIPQRIFNAEIIPIFARIIVLIVLVWHGMTLRNFALNWLRVGDVPQDTYKTAADLRKSPAGYVQLFSGIYESPLLQQSAKIYDLNPGWFWSGKVVMPPPEYFILNKSEVRDPDNTELVSEINGWRLLHSKNPDNNYASVIYEDGTIVPCQASTLGGQISVQCITDKPGILRVYEYNRGYWHVSVNDNKSEMLSDSWVKVSVTAGSNTIVFQYYPWYASVYISMLVLGIILSVVLLIWPRLADGYIRNSLFRDSNESPRSSS